MAHEHVIEGLSHPLRGRLSAVKMNQCRTEVIRGHLDRLVL